MSKDLRRHARSELDDAFVGYDMQELKALDVAAESLDDPVLSGRGAMQPKMRELLDQFRDVLVTEIPGILPLERLDADGNPIEHTIETDLGTLPFKRNPRLLRDTEVCSVRVRVEGDWALLPRA